MNDLPKELYHEIVSHLDTPREILNFGRTCKKFQLIITEDQVWKRFISEFKTMTSSPLEELKCFLTIRKGSIHELVAKIIGPSNFVKMPVLDLEGKAGSTDYIDFVSNKQMNTSLMKGIDRFNREFVSIKFIEQIKYNENNNEKEKDNEDIKVVTLFQRYTNDGMWTYGTRYSDSFAFDRIKYHPEILDKFISDGVCEIDIENFTKKSIHILKLWKNNDVLSFN